MLPKLAIVTALLAANAALVGTLHASAARPLAHGLSAGGAGELSRHQHGFAYGLNDALVAAFVVAATLARHRDRLIIAGAFLGLAVLLKFYPIVLVPVFAMDSGRIRPRLVLAAGVVVLIGMGAAALVWGEAVFRPILFAADREPKILSILSALSFHPHLVGGQGVVDFLVRTNMAFVCAAGL